MPISYNITNTEDGTVKSQCLIRENIPKAAFKVYVFLAFLILQDENARFIMITCQRKGMYTEHNSFLQVLRYNSRYIDNLKNLNTGLIIYSQIRIVQGSWPI